MDDKQTGDDTSRAGLNRRQVLRGGAAVTGAGLLWAAPVVSGVGMSAAHAATPSSTPAPSSSVSPTVQGITITKDPNTPKLPFTGSGVPIEAAVAVAGGLVAAGGAAYVGAKIRKRKADDGDASEVGLLPEPEPPTA